MGKFTLYRADVDSDRLARALGKVPGVAVASEQSGDRQANEPSAEPAGDETAPTVESEDDGGFREKLPVPDTDGIDGEQTSVVKTYGLLGLGVSMVMLGVATVGIWVYRRRKASDGESETPAPATGLDTGGPATSPTGPVATEPAADESVSVVRPDEESESAEKPEPRGRTEGDRSDVEWMARDTTPAAEPAAGESDEFAPREAESETDSRPTESVDAAPLLGAAFLAVTGAVVKWLQADDQP